MIDDNNFARDQIEALLAKPHTSKHHLRAFLTEIRSRRLGGATTDIAGAVVEAARRQEIPLTAVIARLQYIVSNYNIRPVAQFSSSWYPYDVEEEFDLPGARTTLTRRFQQELQRGGIRNLEPQELREWTLVDIYNGFDTDFRLLFVRLKERDKHDKDTGYEYRAVDLEKHHVIFRSTGIEVRAGDAEHANELVADVNGILRRDNLRAIQGGENRALAVDNVDVLNHLLDILDADLTYYLGLDGTYSCHSKAVKSDALAPQRQARDLRTRAQHRPELIPYLQAPLQEAKIQFTFQHPYDGYLEEDIKVYLRPGCVRFSGTVSEVALQYFWDSLGEAHERRDQNPQP